MVQTEEFTPKVNPTILVVQSNEQNRKTISRKIMCFKIIITIHNKLFILKKFNIIIIKFYYFLIEIVNPYYRTKPKIL